MKDPRYSVVAGACLTQFTVIGFLFGFGVFFAELERSLGWSRTMLSFGTSLAFLAMGTFAIVAGRLNDRFGPRIVLTAAGLSYGTGIVLMSMVGAPWQYFLLFGTLIGAGFAAHDVVTLSTIAGWFDKRRGIMTGIVKTGTALGQVAVPPVAAALILAYGWRPAMLIIGLIAGVILVLAAQLMRRPEPADHPEAVARSGQSYTEARRTRVFWMICAMQFLFFPTLMTVPTHLAVHGQDLGMSPETSALLLSLMGAASIAGRLAIGGIADRFGGRAAYSVALLGLGISLLGLTVITGHAALFANTILYGFAHGALFVVVSPTVSRYFGMRAHGAIFGMVVFFGTIGGSVGPTLAGWVYDTWGSYNPAFITLAAATGLAIVIAQILPKIER